MRLLVDECTGQTVASWLRGQGHDVVYVGDEASGIQDTEVIARAASEARILVTNDRDFGDMIFRSHLPHAGVVLLRLRNERPSSKIAVLERILKEYGDSLADNFVVVTEHLVRFARR
jgi:predicted nuclease of predicted toxin-antitoxin system